MTRDELRKRIEIILNNYSIGYDLDHINANKLRVDHILNTIFDSLKEPTDEMCFAGGEYVLSVGSIDCMHVDDRPEFGMKGRETGSYELFQAMLSASPLAPEE